MLTGNRELSMFVVQVLQNRECNMKPAVLFYILFVNYKQPFSIIKRNETIPI